MPKCRDIIRYLLSLEPASTPLHTSWWCANWEEIGSDLKKERRRGMEQWLLSCVVEQLSLTRCKNCIYFANFSCQKYRPYQKTGTNSSDLQFAGKYFLSFVYLPNIKWHFKSTGALCEFPKNVSWFCDFHFKFLICITHDYFDHLINLGSFYIVLRQERIFGAMCKWDNLPDHDIMIRCWCF